MVFILKMFQELFFAFFLFQKIAENHKNSENFYHKYFFACMVFSYKGWANFSLYSRVFRRSNLLARPRLSTQKKSIKPKYMFDQKTRTIGFYPFLPRMNLQLLFLMRFYQKLWKRELCTLNIF